MSERLVKCPGSIREITGGIWTVTMITGFISPVVTITVVLPSVSTLAIEYQHHYHCHHHHHQHRSTNDQLTEHNLILN